MAPEQNPIDKSYIDSLKKSRDELVAKKAEVLKTATSTDSEVKKAIERCPKKENVSSDILKQRIEKLEDEIEVSSFSAQKEKEQLRKIAEIKKQLENVSKYESAQKEIDALKKKREACYKEANELSAKITELIDTILYSEARLRLKEVTGRDMKKESLARTQIVIPSDKIGRICGKANSNLRKLEESYKVYLFNGREGLLVIGEKAGVDKCEAMVKDLLNEVEVTFKLEKDEIHALMAHNSKYRKQIEAEFHVNSRLVDSENFRLIGGPMAVKQAERAIHDMFRKKMEMSVTPFARSLFLADNMKLFKEVQEKCDCYLGLNKDFSAILFYGVMEDQRKAMVVLKEFVDTHKEVTEERICSFLFYNYLFRNKAEELAAVRKAAQVKLNGVKEKNVITVAGLEENVKKAMELLKEKEEKMKEEMIEVDLNSAQLNELLTKNNAFLKELREKYSLLSDISRENKKWMLVVSEEKKEEVKAKVLEYVGQIESIVLQIPLRLIPQFIGTKGKNISGYQKKHGIQMDLQDKSGELTLSGQKESMLNAKKEIEEWLVHHTLCSLEAEYDICMQCIVGKKGATRTQLEKDLGVEIRVEKEGIVWVMGEPEACTKAVQELDTLVKTFERENSAITVREDILKNAPEFRQAHLSAKMKEAGVEYQMNQRRHSVHLNGKEEAIKQASEYLHSLLEQYKNYKEQTLAIPKAHIGSLVGKNGEHLRALQEELKVMINTAKDDTVSIWGDAAQLPVAEEAILKDLKNRVVVSKEVACTVKQVEFLTADYNAVRTAIEDETGAKVYIPRDLPAVGPTKVTVSGNEEQVAAALPIVREATMGMLRQRIELTAEELKALLAHDRIQIQRIQLESRCRIQSNETTGEVLLVGPKEGIQLVYKRFWSVLSELFPAKYQLLVLDEVVRLGLEDRAVEKEMKQEEAKEKGMIRLLADCVILTSPADSGVKQFMEELIARMKETNRLIFVGKEMISFVIGTKGARINQIKKNSNATLRVLRDEMVLISGAPEAIAKAAELLETALEEYKATHVTLTVEEELLNSVRGVRNSNILAIQREYNVRINVDRSGLISIQGTDKEMVEKVSMDLNESIEKARENPEIISRPMREVRPRRVVEEKKEEVSAAGLWERLKQAPLLPSLGKTVGGSESYK